MSVKARPKRSQADLQKAAQHVEYEIGMLIYTADHIGGEHSSPKSAPVGDPKNMALESFLLHFRNLRAFLCPSLQMPPKLEDIVRVISLRSRGRGTLAMRPAWRRTRSAWTRCWHT
jgi:hypothetical protein